MHAAQPGSRSPKPTNGSSSTQQLKSASENIQSSNTSLPLQVKGKKRERNEQNTEAIKRERVSKIDDGDSSAAKFEILKADITKITEKGGLSNVEAVEKLVHLMQLDRADRKTDLSGRVLLADVIASTDRLDCLDRFVQLKGLSVLDEWLQELHRGKSGDCSSPKDSDRSVEDLLLALLRALDKLPVDLHALQTCNIGKSVNHLRSHKNMEIQKKARSLVDTWKKRVDAEMTKTNDVKTVSSVQTVAWPVKSGFGESSHVGIRHPSPAEVVIKAPPSQPSTSKTAPSKPGHSDAILKSPGLPATSKAETLVQTVAVGTLKDTKEAGSSVTPEVLPMTIKEEKSSGSSQSQTNSQPSSSCKEEARNTNAGPINVNKISASTSRNRRSSNGSIGTGPADVQKETNLGKSGLLGRAVTPDKTTHSGRSDFQSTDHGAHRLVVRLSNSGRSPAHTTSGGSFEDTPNRASSPSVSDKYDNDPKIKNRADASADEQVGSYKLLSNSIEELRNANERCSSAESGAKLSGNSPAVDEVGMNLLASVAVGETSKMVSPSALGCSSVVGDNEVNPKGSADGAAARGDAETVMASSDLLGDGKSSLGSQEKIVANDSQNDSACGKVSFLKNDRKLEEEVDNGFSTSIPDSKPLSEVEGNFKHHDELKKGIGEAADNSLDSKPKSRSPSLDEKKLSDLAVEMTAGGDPSEFHTSANSGCDVDGVACSTKTSKLVVESISCHHSSVDENKLNAGDEGIKDSTHLKPRQSLSSEILSDAVDKIANDAVAPATENSLCPRVDCIKAETVGNPLESANGEQMKQSSIVPSAISDCSGLVVSNSVAEEALACCPTIMANNKEPRMSICEPEQPVGLAGSQVYEATADEKVEHVESTSGVSAGPDATVKIDFDLNEGLLGDDDNHTEVGLPSPVCSSAMLIPGLSLRASSSTWNGSPVHVTVAAPAKGPFAPPENLFKGKAEPGWKGSAATSAFLPAEPRKAPETLLSTSDAPSANTGTTKPALDIDLNVVDERVLEDVASQSSVQTTGSESVANGPHEVTLQVAVGLDLDLNRNDEACDNGLPSASTTRQMADAPLLPVRPASGGLRDFDLNGPGFDDVGERGLRNQLAKSSTMPLLPQVTGLRLNNAEPGNISAWFPPGTSYPAVAIPSFLPDRSEHSYAVVSAAGRAAGGGTFGDLYRPPVLASPPTMAFSGATPFPYAEIPFSSRFHLGSNSFSGGPGAYMDSSSGDPCFPGAAIPSQPFGAATSVSSNYQRPCMISLPEASTSNGPESSRRWPRQGLDLNTGPVNAEAEVRDDRVDFASRQVSIASSQAFAEVPARLYQISGGGSKRKEPGGGLDVEKFSYKQPSWQ